VKTARVHFRWSASIGPIDAAVIVDDGRCGSAPPGAGARWKIIVVAGARMAIADERCGACHGLRAGLPLRKAGPAEASRAAARPRLAALHAADPEPWVVMTTRIIPISMCRNMWR
jgi:mono/diheme cytochrome c family protein